MEVEIPVKTFREALFHLWLPPQVLEEDLRAILVITPGSNDTGKHWLPEWYRYATNERLALIGCTFRDSNPGVIEGYADAKEESGMALLDALDQFAVKHPRLGELSLLMWGFSAGGQFSYEMNAAFPEDVLAFVANKGGIYYTALASPAARANAGLFFLGDRDANYRKDIIRGLWSLNTACGANWKLYIEQTGHSLGRSEDTSKEFFSQVLREKGL